jgi:hypothetical protein
MSDVRCQRSGLVLQEVQYLCTKIIELCEGLIHSKDSLVIQPSYVDYITLRKRSEQEIVRKYFFSIFFNVSIFEIFKNFDLKKKSIAGPAHGDEPLRDPHGHGCQNVQPRPAVRPHREGRRNTSSQLLHRCKLIYIPATACWTVGAQVTLRSWSLTRP